MRHQDLPRIVVVVVASVHDSRSNIILACETQGETDLRLVDAWLCKISALCKLTNWSGNVNGDGDSGNPKKV